MHMNTSHQWSSRDYLLPVFRFKWRVVAVLAFGMSVAALWICLAPRKYASESKLFVRLGRENIALDPTVNRNEVVGVNATREAEINSIVEHLRSRAILEKALAILEPGIADASPQEREDALRRLRKSVGINSPHESTVVTVRCAAPSPEDAQRAVATLVDVYLDEHMRINRAPGAYAFFVEQSERLKGQLESAQAALRDAKNKAGMASIEGRRKALEDQIAGVETQVQGASAALSATEAKIGSLKSSVGSLPEPLMRQMVRGTPNDGAAAMAAQLFDLRIRYREAMSKYTELHPKAIALRDQMEEVETALKREGPQREQIMTALLADGVADRASVEAQKGKLQTQLGELTTRLVALNEDELTITKLTREVQQLETRYLAYTKSGEEARVDQALRTDRISNVSIIQPATFEPRPVSPQIPLTLLLGLLGGSLGGVGMAFLADRSDQTLRTCEDVRANLGVPGLVAVPHMQRRRAVPAGGNGVGASPEG